MIQDKNIPVLNSLRAIAALSVCLYHYVCTVTGLVNSEYIINIFSFGKYGVQMFFVISGFIIPWSLFHSSYTIKHYFTFVAKRFIRLEPPYIVSLICAIIYTYIRLRSPHYNGVDTTPTTRQIALHFGYLIPFFKDEHWIRPVYWTLAIEFQYYLSIGICFPLIASKKIYLRLISYVIILSGPVFMNSFLPYHLPVFLLGISLFLYKAKIIQWQELLLLTAASSFEILFYHDIGTFSFSAVAYIAILFFTQFKNKILSFLGDISYSIYLFHSITGVLILNYCAHLMLSPFYKILLIVAAVCITILSAYIVYRVIELPSKRLSSRIKYKKPKE